MSDYCDPHFLLTMEMKNLHTVFTECVQLINPLKKGS